MAIQYVVTEEELLSLLESLELYKLRERNIIRADMSKPISWDELHSGFHYVVTRWIQSIGFKGYRG